MASIPGIETLGHMCGGACGSADERKCSISHEECASDLCLVDPASDLIAYCTVDCTARACPAGFRCEAIKAFGHDEVTHGCVAETASCGDGIVQLGEVCDGDDGVHGHCVDCARWEAACGDGAVQEGEACDGDDAEGYCNASCTARVAPQFRITAYTWEASAMVSYTPTTSVTTGWNIDYGGVDAGGLPLAGDSSGCGSVRVLDSTAELTRLEWVQCDTDGQIRATWNVAIPRTETSYATPGSAAAAGFQAEVTLRADEYDREVTWTMDDATGSFQLDTYIVDDPATTYTNIDLWFEKQSPLASFQDDYARMNVLLVMTHPVVL